MTENNPIPNMKREQMFTFPSVYKYLSEIIQRYSCRFFVIIDDKVLAHSGCDFDCQDDALFFYPFRSVENRKTLEEVSKIYSELIRQGFSKEDMIVNVGGGIVCDVGGFVASTYKRGMRFINIPTTLLAMIDAAHGGKNGVNHDQVKNAAGAIQLPEKVIVDLGFLNTLPEIEMLNGFGELIKYALIADREMWNEISNLSELTKKNIPVAWIDRCIAIKEELVTQDLNDRNVRRMLNFGHTIGHALESVYLSQGVFLSHGHAVALGLCCESYISHLHGLLPMNEVERVKEVVLRFFTAPELPLDTYPKIMEMVMQDKKNRKEEINMTLLESVGNAIPNQQIAKEEVERSLEYLFV